MSTDKSDHHVDEAPDHIKRVIGVYHAKGSAMGELAYWIKARVGGAHCALCEITHGSVREKDEWRRCSSELPVEVETVHLDERSPDLTAFTEGRTPCVVADTAAGFVMLVETAELEACEGSPACLVDAITSRATMLDLVLG